MKVLKILILIFSLSPGVHSQQLYFPPAAGTTWDTISPLSLGWCPDKIDTLTDYLQDKNTKAFIVLKDGKIVIEEYFGTFTMDSIWYWASAGKSLAAFLTGIAQEEGLLSINDTVSEYLGTGWTTCSSPDEDKITIRHQLTMTSGLDDDVPDPDCTLDTCLVCIDTAGGRWAYHNAPYRLVHDVLEAASGTTLNLYTYSHLATTTGMAGLWVDHVFYSTARSMARFGLLALAQGIWNNDTLLHDANYFQQMVNTSQSINPSYGYLWWLNGKGSYMVPQSQLLFPGDLVPDAPDDMFAALGKNDQKIYVVPSQNLVVVRMGNNSGNFPLLAISSFDNELWGKLNDVFCGTLSLENENQLPAIVVYPNPASDIVNIKIDNPGSISRLRIYDNRGSLIYYLDQVQSELNISGLSPGFYNVTFTSENATLTKRFLTVETY